MNKVWLGAAGLVAIVGISTPVYSQDECAGDCDGNKVVAINELISCVNITLDNSDVSSCAPCDVNGDGRVAINELVTAVNKVLEGCMPMGACGNGAEDSGEDCDDGNNFGGDGCSANCTDEEERVGVFDSTRTLANVQSFGLLVGPLMLTGNQTLRVGRPRDTDTMGPNNEVLFKAGELPVAIRSEELNIEPVSVLGAICACVRGIPVPDQFGPGVSGSGTISCNDEGLQDISYRVIQDHNTTPGDVDNLVQATPDDEECDDVSMLPGNTESLACLEGTGEACADADRYVHVGVCIGPRVLTRSGGPAGRGSAFILNNSAIGQLGGGDCDTTGLRNGVCPSNLEDYGPDCLPCTDDDLEKGVANNLPTTSGTAEAAIFDVNLMGNTIDRDLECNSSGAICVTSVTGNPVNCDAIISGTGNIGGGLAVAFPGIDSATILDAVTTTLFVNQE